MGQKVNPIGFRVSATKAWRSKWYAEDRAYGDLMLEDLKIRTLVKRRLEMAAVSDILIERSAGRARVTIYSARPGLVIGRRGAEIERLKKDLSEMTNKEILIEIREIKVPELDALLVAENVATQMERRVAFRRAMKRSVQTSMDLGALGIKVRCSGRLGGAELARTASYRQGSIPLQMLRADVDYGFAEARTVYGKIGVKVWICKAVHTSVGKGGAHGADAKTGQVP